MSWSRELGQEELMAAPQMKTISAEGLDGMHTWLNSKLNRLKEEKRS